MEISRPKSGILEAPSGEYTKGRTMKLYDKVMSKTAQTIFRLSTIFECIISAIILIAIVMETITIVIDFQVFQLPLSTVKMTDILGSILWLVIGLEFIKMLMEHSHGAVLEVMLFAIARQIIVDHTSMLENLLGVTAIAVVFVVRKFLYNQNDDKVMRRFGKAAPPEEEVS